MNPLVNRITAVLRAHAEWFNPVLSRWQWEFDELTAHVAEQIAAELQLTEEFSVVTDMGITSNAGLTEHRVRELAREHEDMTARSRWVSAWSAAEEKP